MIQNTKQDMETMFKFLNIITSIIFVFTLLTVKWCRKVFLLYFNMIFNNNQQQIIAITTKSYYLN